MEVSPVLGQKNKCLKLSVKGYCWGWLCLYERLKEGTRDRSSQLNTVISRQESVMPNKSARNIMKMVLLLRIYYLCVSGNMNWKYGILTF